MNPNITILNKKTGRKVNVTEAAASILLQKPESYIRAESFERIAQNTPAPNTLVTPIANEPAEPTATIGNETKRNSK